nr:NADH dehydrogenase subunit 6 [Apophysomyces elegans]
MNTILLDLLAFGSVLSGVLVITSRNRIISVLFLIAVFVNVSCYLILLGINFIGLTYLIIYVGAIAILFLFVVMMMNIKLVELTEVNNKGEYTNTLRLGAIVGSLFLYELAFQPVPTSVSGISSTVYNLFHEINLLSVNTSFKGTAFNSAGIEAYTSFNNLWDNAFTSFQQLESVGSSLYTVHMMFLIIASMILLLAMIGPIVLTHKPTIRLH